LKSTFTCGDDFGRAFLLFWALVGSMALLLAGVAALLDFSTLLLTVISLRQAGILMTDTTT
jgi:hypothetical protein